MNFYLAWIIGFLTLVFLLDTTSDLLNLNYLKQDLPAEFQGIYDSEKYSQSLSYQREGTYFEFIRRTFFFGLTLLFILLGGFNSADQFARSFHYNTVITGLIFIGTLSFIRFCFQLPFSLYDTFVIEEKYGFNKTTVATFFLDILKGTLLGVILGAPIFAGIVYFFETAGMYGWLYSWMAVTFFQIVLAYIAPAIIMPLFNKFSPLPDGKLRQAIEEYARKKNFKLQGIFTMDSSKRSTKSNAFFTGFGRFRRLVLFDTLVEKHSTEELMAVFAHEVGHFKRKHIIKSMILSIVTLAITFYLFGLFLNNPDLFLAFRMSEVSVYASLIFISILYSPLARVLSIFTQRLSRKYEFEADEFAYQTYGHAEMLISALKKLSRDNLSHLTPHPLKIILDYTHPPVLDRINALRQLAKSS